MKRRAGAGQLIVIPAGARQWIHAGENSDGVDGARLDAAYREVDDLLREIGRRGDGVPAP
jgi:hypothetical protein